MEEKVPEVIRVVTLNSICSSLYSHRFSTLMLTPQRWFSTGSHSRSWHASYESDPRRGRMASLCDLSSTAVRLRVRKICHLPCLRRLSQTFFQAFPSRHWALVNAPRWSCQIFLPVIYWLLTSGQKVARSINNSKKCFLGNSTQRRRFDLVICVTL